MTKRVLVSMEFTVELPEDAVDDDPLGVRLSMATDAILVSVDGQRIPTANVIEFQTTHVELIPNEHT